MNAIDLSQAIAQDSTDPTLTAGTPSFTYLDANFGMSYFISKEISFGLSVDNFVTNVFADRADRINYSATTFNWDVRFYAPDLKKGAPRLFIDATVQHRLGLQTEFSGYARVGELDQNIGVGYRSSGDLWPYCRPLFLPWVLPTALNTVLLIFKVIPLEVNSLPVRRLTRPINLYYVTRQHKFDETQYSLR